MFNVAAAEFWTYVEKSFTWTDLPSKFPTKYVQFPVSGIHVYFNCDGSVFLFVSEVTFTVAGIHSISSFKLCGL